MSSKLILVTGVSGFLGSHVVDKLVSDGYRVRGTVRPPKVARIQEKYDQVYGAGRVEVSGVDDIIDGDFTAALKGVDAIIHVASPMTGRTDPETNIQSAVTGTMNIVQQGYKAGIKLFSVASSITACISSDEPFRKLTEKDWNKATQEQALDGTRDAYYVYFASKGLAEKALRAFGEEHKEITIVTLNPPYFVGPYAPGQIISPGDVGGLSTNLVLYNLLFPDSKDSTSMYGYVDVPDVAVGLIAALKQTRSSRNLLGGEWFQLKDAVEHLADVRPELKDRLPNATDSGQTEGPIDNDKALKTLEMPSVTKWENMVVDTIDAMVKIEKDWSEAGVDLENGLKNNYYRA